MERFAYGSEPKMRGRFQTLMMLMMVVVVAVLLRLEQV